jgi:hypothetical protein
MEANGTDCAAAHDAMRITPELWSVGVEVIGQVLDRRGRAYPLGNCRACGTTLAFEPKKDE